MPDDRTARIELPTRYLATIAAELRAGAGKWQRAATIAAAALDAGDPQFTADHVAAALVDAHGLTVAADAIDAALAAPPTPAAPDPGTVIATATVAAVRAELERDTAFAEVARWSARTDSIAAGLEEATAGWTAARNRDQRRQAGDRLSAVAADAAIDLRVLARYDEDRRIVADVAARTAALDPVAATIAANTQAIAASFAVPAAHLAPPAPPPAAPRIPTDDDPETTAAPASAVAGAVHVLDALGMRITPELAAAVERLDDDEEMELLDLAYAADLRAEALERAGFVVAGNLAEDDPGPDGAVDVLTLTQEHTTA